jgi:hypothetical protein
VLLPALLVLAGLGMPRAAAAQGTVQVRALNIPPRLNTPFIEDLVRAYQQGQYPIQIVYTTPSRQAQPMQIRVELSREGQTLFEVISDPVPIAPGVRTVRTLQDLPGVSFGTTLAELVDQISDADLRQQIRRTGALPEGSYTLTIEALPDDAFITTLPSTSVFIVEYAQPPLILTPPDGATVAQAYPVFAWTPVIGPTTLPLNYDVRLVELLPDQTPRQALEANRAYVEQTVQATTFVYGPQQLPLTPGRTYVWQVTARDPAGQLPIADGGRTPIQTFRYTDVTRPGESLADLDRIVIEPGFAALTNLEIEADEEATSYRLNGSATLELQFDDPVRVAAAVQDLEIQKTGLDSPVVLGGGVSASLRGVTLPVGPAAAVLDLDALDWAFGDGFAADGHIALPSRNRSIEATGTLRLSQAGLQGRLVAESGAGSPLLALEQGPLGVRLDRLVAAFPSGQLLASGDVSMFGETGACTVNGADLLDDEARVLLACDETYRVPLFGDTDRAVLAVDRPEGTLGMALDTGAMSFDLQAPARLTFATTSATPACEVQVPLTLSSAQGVSVGTATTTCPNEATFDLGLVQATVVDLAVDRLVYQNATWDAALSLDATFEIPALDLLLPTIEGITLDQRGLTVPATTVEALVPDPDAPTDDPSLGTFEVAGYVVAVRQLSLPQTPFPWFTWDGEGAGPWDMAFDVGVTFPGDARVPACLRTAQIDATGFRVANEALGGQLSVENLGTCRWDVGGGYALQLNGLSGQLAGADLSDAGFTGTSDVTLDAALELGEPFRCDAETPGAVQLPPGRLRIHGQGRLNGSLPNVLPQCPVGVGPFTAGITQSELVFEYAQALGQSAQLDAQATLQLPGGQGADGEVGVDVWNGELNALRFELRDPFRWNIPQDEPALAFRIQSAAIDLDGLSIDGRNELLFDNGRTLGATFDNLLLGLETFEIEEGQILFDGAFGLAAGIDSTAGRPGALTYAAVPEDYTLGLDPGAHIELAGQVRIDTLGLHATGSAAAALRYDRWTPESPFLVAFSRDFLMGLYPFGVRRGQADLMYQEQRVAYIDATGFHIGAGLITQVLPARLPLPTEQLAYLQLKDPQTGQPYVSTQSMPDGTIKIETLQGERVDLVLPALQGVGGAAGPPPRLSAAFSDVRVDVSGNGTFVYNRGTVTATVNGPSLDLAPLGVPLYLQEARYGPRPGGNGSEPHGLFLRGSLALFGDDLGPPGTVTLAVDPQRIAGSFDLPTLDASIALAGSRGQLALRADSIGGTIDVPFQGTPLTQVDVNGRIALDDVDGTELAAAGLGLQLNPIGVSVTRFTPSVNPETAMLDLGAVQLGIDGINGLTRVAYDPQTGAFDFRLGLDVRFGLEMPSGRVLEVPLRQVQLSPQGFELPQQQINAGTAPALADTQTVALGPVELRLFDARLGQDVTIDWLGTPSQALDALAGLELGLGLRVPAHPGLGREFTIADASFGRGIITGQLDASPFLSGLEPRIGLGGDLGLYVSELSGALTNDNGQQGIDITFEGDVDLPDFFGPPPQASPCPDTNVAFTLSRSGGLTGTVADFAACVSFAYGPATLTFPTSALDLGVDAQGAQTAVLDAQAEASIVGVNGNVTGSGAFDIDLLTGDILNASIALNGAFDYGLPEDDPVFVLRIQQASLQTDGILVNGTGSFMPGGVDAGVQFSQFTINPLTPEIVRGSATIQSGFALEAQLAGDTNWQVVPTGAAVSGGTVLRMDLPASLVIDRNGLRVDGSTTASFSYDGTSYASLTADFQSLQFGVQPFRVRGGRVEFLDGPTTLAYYDVSGFHYDAAGIVVAVLPARIPLPSEDVAYLQIKDAQGNALVTYDEIPGGYRLNSITDGQGAPQPLALVIPAVQSAQQDTLRADITLADLEVNSTFQHVMNGRIVAATTLDLTDLYNVPLRIDTLRYAKEQGAYALTADGTANLPEGFGGGEEITFADVGFTSQGLSGTFTAGQTPYYGACDDLPGGYQPQSPLGALVYSGGQSIREPTAQQLRDADLAISVRAVQFNLNPGGTNAFGVLGDVQSRLTADPSDPNAEPGRLPFVSKFTAGVWSGALCTDPLPDDSGGGDKINILLASLYLDDNNSGSAEMEIDTQTGAVDVILSGTLAVPALGGDFGATVRDLRLGASGVSVAQAGAQAQGQEFRLFDDNVRVHNDRLTLAWDNGRDALVLSLDGTLWLVPYMCEAPQNGPAVCNPNDAATFDGLTADTRGSIGLTAASIDLLGANADLVVLGTEQDPNLTVDDLRLEKRQNDAQLSLAIGGTATLPDFMEGAEADIDVRLFADGSLSGGPISVTFGAPQDQIDNISTEIDIAGLATMDVKEVGIAFEQDKLKHTSLFANGSLYVQGNTDQVIRFGSVGQAARNASGVYYTIGDDAPTFKADTQVTIPEINFEFFSVRQLQVGTNSGPDRPFSLVFGGTLALNLPDVGSVDAQWQGLEINRPDGLVSAGGLGPNGITLSIIDIVTLTVGTIDFDRDGGTVTVGDDTYTTARHFLFGGVNFSLPGIGQDGDGNAGGGVDAVYVLQTTEGARLLGVDNAFVALPGFGANLSFQYMQQDGAFQLLAAGGMQLSGVGGAAIGGAFANLNNEIAFGMALRVESETGIDVIPRVLTLSSVSGGFFYNPNVDMMELALGSCSDRSGGVLPNFQLLGEFDNVPDEAEFDHCDAQKVDAIRLAVFVGAGARVVDAGAGAVMEAEALIKFSTGSGGQQVGLNIEGRYLSLPQLTGLASVNVTLSPNRKEIGGFAGVLVGFDPAASGTLGVGFYAVGSSQPEPAWAIDGAADLDVALGLLNASGDFLLCRDGMLATLNMDTGFDIWVISVTSTLEMEAWVVTGTDNFGAYFGVEVNASLVGGLAELGANAKGAYINRERLFYATASGYIRVGCAFNRCVFDGRKTIWLSFRGGEGFEGGEGSNSRYENMITDARQDAQDMIAGAQDAKDALDQAQSERQVNPFQFTEAQIQAAGIQLIGADPNARAAWAQSMLDNEDDVYRPPALRQMQAAIRDDVILGNRTSYGSYLDDLERQIRAKQQLGLPLVEGPVSRHLNDLTARAITWNTEALERAQSLRSPVSGVTRPADGTAAPSFTVDTLRAQQQVQALDDFRSNAEALDAQYRASINAVAANLDKLSGIMSGETTAWFFFSFDVSANTLANAYADLVGDVQDFYSARADLLWSTRRWAQDRLGDFTGSGRFRASEVRSRLDTNARAMPSAKHDQAADIAYERVRLVLEDLGNAANFQQTLSTYSSTIDGYKQNDNGPAIEAEYTETGVALWHDVPEAGLRSYVDSLRLRAEQTPSLRQAKLRPILRHYRDFSESVNALYVIKADMAVTLYGMLEEYLAFRASAYGPQTVDVGNLGRLTLPDDTLALYRSHADDLLQHLRPPRLSSIYVSRTEADAHRRQARFWYAASHDKGIPEWSMNWREGSTSTNALTGFRRFYTMGDRPDMKLWVSKDALNEQSEDLSVAVRVRGSAGVTQTRRVTASFNVDPGTGGVTILDSGQDILDTDTTPPVGSLALPYDAADVGEGSTSTLSLQLSSGLQRPAFPQPASGGGVPSLNGGSNQASGQAAAPLAYDNAYWTDDPSQLRYTVSAFDAESDVQRYAYAIGSTEGGTDVADWAEGVGRRSLAGDYEGIMANFVFQGITRGLRLEPGRPYYVSARVENGAGITATYEEDTPLVYDDSPPSAPRAASEPVVLQELNQRGGVVSGHDPVQSAPPAGDPLPASGNPYQPRATVKWSGASDPESGIKEYEYVVADPATDPADAFANPDAVEDTRRTSVVLYGTGDGLSFFEDRVVHVRAVNHAGSRGDILTIGPFRPVDPTPPRAARLRVQVMPDGVRLYLRHPAADRESSIRGYRYRVEAANANGTFVTHRDYPTGIDFSPQCRVQPTNSSGTASSGTASSGTASSGTASGGGLYVQIGQQTQPMQISAAAQTAAAQSATVDVFPAASYNETGCLQPYTDPSAPYLFIPDTNVPRNTRLRFLVEAVNYQGVARETKTGHPFASSTLIVLDDTAPPKPTIAGFSVQGGGILLNIDDVHDPESGVVRVEYAVRDANGRTSSWSDLATIDGVQTASTDYYTLRSWASRVPAFFGTPQDVGIRVTNSNGQQTVTWTHELLLVQPGTGGRTVPTFLSF